MAIDSQWISKFSDTNLIEIEESTPLLENRKFTKVIFFFFFLKIHISLAISGTLMRILEHIEYIKM